MNFDIDAYKVDVVGYTKTTKTTATYPVPTLSAAAIGKCTGRLADELVQMSARCSNMPNECSGWSETDETDCVRLCCNAGRKPPYYVRLHPAKHGMKLTVRFSSVQFSYSFRTKQCYCLQSNETCGTLVENSMYETHLVIDVSNHTTVGPKRLQ